MHNGISKFSTEFNGVFLRGINEHNNPINFLFSFTKVNGDLNAFGLVNKLFKTIGKVTNCSNSAFSTIFSKLCKHTWDTICLFPPQYFKIGALKSIDIIKKVIWIDVLSSLPVSVNPKAARIMPLV